MATSGPGATNLVTGIATAMLDSIPLIAITGQVSSKVLGSDAFQEVDITGITLPITKHNFLDHARRGHRPTVRLAFQIAQFGRPGPVLVDITKDAQQATAPFNFRGRRPRPRAPTVPCTPCLRAESTAIREAVALIAAGKEARHPRRPRHRPESGAEAEVLAFAEHLQHPHRLAPCSASAPSPPRTRSRSA